MTVEEGRQNRTAIRAASDVISTARRHQIIDLVKCPVCRSPKGTRCRTNTGKATKLHAKRISTALASKDFQW